MTVQPQRMAEPPAYPIGYVARALAANADMAEELAETVDRLAVRVTGMAERLRFLAGSAAVLAEAAETEELAR